MARSGSHINPRFVWQPILIVLPVLILAGIGVISVRQDKALARQEAAEQAQVLADELLERVGVELASTNPGPWVESQAFQLSARGELLFPPLVAAVPIPRPFDLSVLNGEQSRLWREARTTEELPQSPEKALDSYREFLASGPPEDFAASAHYSAALLLQKEGEYRAAAQELDEILKKYPEARGESGIPLAPLAQVKLLESLLEPNRIQPGWESQRHVIPADTFYSNLVDHPTPLTGYILNRSWAAKADLFPGNSGGPDAMQTNLWGNLEAARQKWLRIWGDREFSRRLFVAAFQLPEDRRRMSYGASSLAGSEQIIKEGSNSISVTPRLFWFQMENQNWLATRFDEENLRYWFACRTEEQVGLAAAAATAKMRQIPNYFEIHADVGGVIFARSQGTNWAARMARNETGHPSTLSNPASRLASATQSMDGKELIKMSFYLGNPADFFKRQHIRTLWFAALIAVSAVAALIGLFTSWRAFAQQRSLTDLKTNFVSSVSHELRAPIASVRLMAENLERGKVQEPQRQSEYFRFIGQECRRLSALIENVLDFSRIEQRRKQYELEPTDLLALVRQTVALMQNNAAEKGVELVLRIANSQSPAAPGHGEQKEALEYQLSLDGHAMQQALVNLIDNALKHSPQGKGVTVGLEMSEAGSQKPAPDNRKVLLWVEDHGPGIPLKEQERIFERFYRLGSELRRDTQGVGIGLSIVKHVVEAHGGEVIVRSTVGEGSRFIIELPVESQESD